MVIDSCSGGHSRLQVGADAAPIVEGGPIDEDLALLLG